MNFFDANFLTVGIRKLFRTGRRRRDMAPNESGDEVKDERRE